MPSSCATDNPASTGFGKMIRIKKALSIDFEGLMGAGKTTAIKSLAAELSPQSDTVWTGTGFPYSLKRAVKHETPIQEWVAYRQGKLRLLESCTDFMLLERSSFSDISNLCFRKGLISLQRLLDLTEDWWPTFVVLINTPFDDCITNIMKRGDQSDVADLREFQRSLSQTKACLAEYLGDRLKVVNKSQEAIEFARDEIRKARI